jgi:hypothetical protein
MSLPPYTVDLITLKHGSLTRGPPALRPTVTFVLQNLQNNLGG